MTPIWITHILLRHAPLIGYARCVPHMSSLSFPQLILMSLMSASIVLMATTMMEHLAFSAIHCVANALIPLILVAAHANNSWE